MLRKNLFLSILSLLVMSLVLTSCGATEQAAPDVIESPTAPNGTGGQLIAIESDNVQAAGFNAPSSVMTVQFNNGNISADDESTIWLSTIDNNKMASANIWQSEMLKSINKLRMDKGLLPLTLCKSLASSAQKYAQVMADQNFLSHKGKDGSRPGDRMDKAGYRWKKSTSGSMVAENIAAGQKSVTQVMNGWVKSKSHYKNIVERKFIHVGFGQARNQASKYDTYWVQNFGFGAEC